jgi:hypothetical protein
VRAADNPFRSECVERLEPRLVADTWDDLLARLQAAGMRGAIVGPQGSGKTTMLATLERLQAAGMRGAIVGPQGSGKTTMLATLGRRLEMAGWYCLALRLDTTAPRLDAMALRSVAAADERVVVLLDGAEQLGHLAWLSLQRSCRRAAGLVITTHRPGRLPTLYRSTTSPALLAELVTELLPAPWPPVPEEVLSRVFSANAGNLREALGQLYDACARAASPASVCWGTLE